MTRIVNVSTYKTLMREGDRNEEVVLINTKFGPASSHDSLWLQERKHIRQNRKRRVGKRADYTACIMVGRTAAT